MLRAKKKRPIITFGHPGLLQAAKDVKKVDQEIHEIIQEMFDVMYAAPGVGLAAPQLNVHKRICVVSVEDDDGEDFELALINPRITSYFGEETIFDEGCLSFPGIHAKILRPFGVTVEAIAPNENEISLRADGLLARVLQHEIDHLNGILFIEHFAERERQNTANALERLKGKSLKKFGLPPQNDKPL